MTRLLTPDLDNIMLEPWPVAVVKGALNIHIKALNIRIVALNIHIVSLSIRIVALSIRIVAPNISRWHP